MPIGYTAPYNGGSFATGNFATSVFFSFVAGALLSFVVFARSSYVNGRAIAQVAGNIAGVVSLTAAGGGPLFGEPMKMALVVRRDLKMGQGKVAAQCAHAAVGVVDTIYETQARELRKSGGSSGGDNTAVDDSFAVASATTAGQWINWLQEWRRSGSLKVVLQVETEADLMQIVNAAQKASPTSLPLCLVRDAGRTQIAAGSKTVCAIGPAPASKVDEITGKLRLL